MGREAQHLVEAVGDVDDRDREALAQPVEERQDFVAARGVERGERLVEQHEPRAREQRPPDRDALALPAREAARPAAEQRPEAEERDDLVELRGGPAALRARHAVAQVPLDVAVREEPRVLEHVADAAPLGRDADAPGRVDERLAAEAYVARVRVDEARDDVDERRLAASGGAEERDDARLRQRECRIEQEAAPALLDRDVEHVRYGPSVRRMRRASHSATRSPASPSTKDTIAMRAASPSPPGVWIAV